MVVQLPLLIFKFLHLESNRKIRLIIQLLTGLGIERKPAKIVGISHLREQGKSDPHSLLQQCVYNNRYSSLPRQATFSTVTNRN